MKYLISISVITFITLQCASGRFQKKSMDIPTEIVNYTNHIKPIIENYCTTCHKGKSPRGRIDLTTYESVRHHAEKGNLLFRINNRLDPMPQGGLISKKERAMFAKWAENNFLEKGNTSVESNNQANYEFTPPTINPVNIEEKGFDFFNQMQGHWVGSMQLMGQDIPWFSFDYRAISPSHIHGIFEGGTMGNLMTSFFIAEYKGTKTIMARNGGILNGIYRISYFILEKVEISPERSYYRFVDVYGGKQIMWMELSFKNNRIEFNSYTSRFGTYAYPKKHMVFKAKKMNMELAKKAAEKYEYPKNAIEKSFPEGLPMPDWGAKYPVVTSATYMWEDTISDISKLAVLAKDPYKMDEIPSLSTLKLLFSQKQQPADVTVQIYLSSVPLTDLNGKLILQDGYIKENLMNKVLLFPELSGGESEFLLTHLHPGQYYITAVIDQNKDLIPSKGDLSSKSLFIEIKEKTDHTITVGDIKVLN